MSVSLAYSKIAVEHDAPSMPHYTVLRKEIPNCTRTRGDYNETIIMRLSLLHLNRFLQLVIGGRSTVRVISTTMRSRVNIPLQGFSEV
jgi:hypothetical protein